MLVPIDRQTLTLKNGQKRNFSYEAKASMSFILMNKMSLWRPIMKKRRLLCENRFIPIER